MKKLISLILSVIMIASMLSVSTIAVSASENTVEEYTLPTGWNPALGGVATQDVMDTLYAVVNNVSASGNHSLRISAIGRPSNVQYYLRPTILSGTDANTYVLSVRVNKPTSNKLDTNMKVFDTTPNECANMNLKWTATPTVDADGWYTYKTAEFTTNAAIKGIDFSVNECTEEFYIDDMSLTKVGGDGTNYIMNSSFEVYPRENTVPAGTHPLGYTFSKGGNATDEILAQTFVVQNDVSSDGICSIVIPKLNPDAGAQYYIYPKISANAPATGTYTFSYKTNVQNGYWQWDGKANIGGTQGAGTVSGPDAYGWYTYSLTGSSSTLPTSLWFMVSGVRTSTTVRFDDFKLTVDGGDTNYIINGSFEEYPKENTIAANAKPKYYTFSHSGNATQAQEDNFFVVQNDFAADGNNSALILSGLNGNNGERCYLTPTIKSGGIAGTYTLSFKVDRKLTYPTLESQLTINDSNGSAKISAKNLGYDAQATSITGPDEYGWYTYNITADFDVSGPGSMSFMIYRAVAPIRFDDFKLTLEGDTTNTNYIRNGSFEQIATEELPKNTLPVGAALSTNSIPEYQVASYFTVTTSDSTHGNNALKIHNTNGWSGKEVRIHLYMAEAAPGGANYTITAKVKESGQNGVELYSMGGSGSTEFKWADPGTDAGYGWREVTVPITVAANKVLKGAEIKSYEKGTVLIDEVTITDASGNVLLYESFEDVVSPATNISDVTFDAATNTATVCAANNTLDNAMNVTLITVINPGSDTEQVSAAAYGAASITKGNWASATATLETAPGDADLVRAFVWDGNTLEPYYEAKDF